jgi:hypothetical protein
MCRYFRKRRSWGSCVRAAWGPGVWQAWKARAVGGPATQVTQGGGYESFESPDGKLLYYSKDDAPGLWSVPVDGGAGTRVLDSVRHFWWALADIGIYFVNADDGQHPGAQRQLSFFSFETRKVVPVGTLNREIPPDTPSLAASRDGRRLLVLGREQSGSDLILVDNFR